MEEVLVLGNLISTTLIKIKSVFSSLMESPEIDEIESGNVLIYDGLPFSFNIEPDCNRDIDSNENMDFLLTGRYQGNILECRAMLYKLVHTLQEYEVRFNITYQVEDENGKPLSDEFEIKNDLNP